VVDAHAAAGPRHTPGEPRIAYSTFGAGERRVLLVMGFGMTGAVWKPQVERLERDHRLCYFDNRGIGASEGEPGAHTIALYARDALRVMDALGWDRAHLVGVSMGGMIAEEMALADEARFESLTLIATHAGGPLAMLPTARGLRSFIRAQVGSPQARIAALTELLYTPEFVASLDRVAHERSMAATVGDRARTGTLLSQLHAIARHDTRRRLGRLRLPTLIVRPGADVLVRPSRSDELARLLPHARMLRLDAGHGCTFECAEALSDALRAHFEAAETIVTDDVQAASS
jgi:pimeloyl-ACP methyl ester carboxylesterase